MPFRWQYIALPAGFLLLSIVIAAIFFAQLPADVAYHFENGIPDRTAARIAFIGWMVVPQIFFTLIAISITRLVMAWSRYAPPGETPLLELLPIMGNILALPQIMMFVAMLQLILYNVYQTGLIPLWIVAVLILVVGGIVLVIMFMRIIKRYRRKKVKIDQELK